MIEVTDEMKDKQRKMVVDFIRNNKYYTNDNINDLVKSLIELHEANYTKPEPLSDYEMPVGRMMVNGVLLSPDCTTAFILGVRFAEQKHGIG